MRYRITTPVRDYNGTTGGIAFDNGTAEVEDIPDLVRTYMVTAGYVIEENEPVQPAKKATAVNKENPA